MIRAMSFNVTHGLGVGGGGCGHEHGFWGRFRVQRGGGISLLSNSVQRPGGVQVLRRQTVCLSVCLSVSVVKAPRACLLGLCHNSLWVKAVISSPMWVSLLADEHDIKRARLPAAILTCSSC
jgi:hypothetical protein